MPDAVAFSLSGCQLLDFSTFCPERALAITQGIALWILKK